MSKFPIEKPPVLTEKITVSLNGATDLILHKGSYLHWDELRWRLSGDNKEAKIHRWNTIKILRNTYSKTIDLKSASGENFKFLIHSSSEAKIHHIVSIARGTFNNFGTEIAPEEITKKFLLSSLIMEEAITSAQLEGAATTREDAKKMLQDEIEPKNEDERMILNNYHLLMAAKDHIHDDLSIDLILKFHEIATQKTTENNVIPGEFRKTDDIYVKDSDDNIIYTPPSSKLLNSRLKLLCNFANTNHSGTDGSLFINPVVKAIILHFMIGYEHPFRDGNGRTARCLFYWFMLKNKYDIFEYISISKLLKVSPKKYGLSYLYVETDDYDLTYFIDHQLEIIVRAFDDLKNYVQNKVNEYKNTLSSLDNSKYADLNFFKKDILKKSLKSPGRIFTVKEISSDYGISRPTARNYLEDLAAESLLYKSKDKKNILYISPSDLHKKIRDNK
ncbi:Fic family protein [Fangia hongkongensis]|uniref:Fic family protein n=1 Tax=Fangia hongkongensis TaxID=270495 RepID=UPI00036ED459|nr:Fic family protein [Fangia hongkongensis]